MTLYETTFITRQDISTQDVDKLTESFIKILEENKGQTVKVEQWGLRDLAYPIKKYNKGYYTFLGIEADNAAIKELERKMRLNEDVLRCVSIKVDAIESEDSAIITINQSE
jgi:small subunit ribosomal protein S6